MNNKKWRKWCKLDTPILFNNSNALPVLTMGTKSPNQEIMFDWSIYTPFVLNTGWKLDSY
jgi:hypothetical protein